MLVFSIGIISIPGSSTPDPSVPPALADLQERVFNGVLAAAYDEIGQSVLLSAFVIAVASIVLLIISFIARGPRRVVFAHQRGRIADCEINSGGEPSKNRDHQIIQLSG
jgi:hypothetical protein